MNDASQTATAADTASEKVQMEDGSTVEFVGKRKLLKESLVDGLNVVSKFQFRNGRVILFTIPDALLAKFAGHGAEQKIGDATAGEKDVDDMVLAVEDLVARLEKGEWNVKREGGGFGGTSVLLRALVEYSGRTTEQVKAFLEGKSQAEKMALRASEAPNKSGATLKSIVARLEAEKVSKGAAVDTAALLETL